MEKKTEQFTLRQLPLPAKLVVTVFLMAVGLGYLWAMMQLHFKHASKGNVLPGVDDVVERFSGQAAPWNKVEAAEIAPQEEKKADPLAAPAKMVAGAKIKSIINERCVRCHEKDGDPGEPLLHEHKEIAKLLGDPPNACKLHKVIVKEDESGWGKDNMTPAFTLKSLDENGDDWKAQKKARPEAELRQERETERLALLQWVLAGAPEELYEKDAFPLPDELAKRPITTRFKTQAAELPKVDSNSVPPKKKKNPKARQLSIESLTQSTHAHLLTFAILWAGTGMVFAFTSYPCWMRIGIAPVVLIAQVADIGCWWLARLPDVGPYFAVAIMGTGAVVGLGLTAQIILSLFNMYGCKGKVVLCLLMLAGAAGGGLVYTKFIAPEIAAEKAA